MAKLTAAQRNALPRSDFAQPSKRKYPINDKSHARNALARVSQHGTADEKRKIRRKVAQRYPSISQTRSR